MNERAYSPAVELLRLSPSGATLAIDPIAPPILDEADPAESHVARPIPIAVDSRGYAVAKRAFDLAFATLLLIATAPIWMLAILLVKTTSPGPLLFRQTRVGRGGAHFTCLKFRSMVDGADDHKHHLWHRNEATGPVFKLRQDPRVTRVGKWMRRFSIDELPQLLNVIHGEMSIVGPRPPLPGEVAHYDAHQLGRLAVKPGLTCYWQVSGRSNIDFDRWVELDLAYIADRSLTTDAVITLKTIPAVLLARGAH
jgi:lipopolysaccharide/colanic/teichoic acid biosynthesis glycosyltransferase